ncbi:MAG: cell division topological specificity factor MinE [Chromatiales bacterium]|nr:cell division topological specificity factor MinE [Chromatiales bacterium]
MGLFDLFRASRKNCTASVAKERLQIIVAHERTQRDRPSYLPLMEKEILEVIRKYVAVDQDAVTINFDREDNCEILELNVVLPDGAEQQSASA